jgi:hypothetical protein
LGAGGISPAVLERLALMIIFGCRAGRKLPLLACKKMNSRVLFHPSTIGRGGLSPTIYRMALIGLRRAL